MWTKTVRIKVYNVLVEGTERQILEMEMIIIENKKKQQRVTTAPDEIRYLRGMEDFLIDRRNSSRYRALVREDTGHTAYCFSTLIYQSSNRHLVQLNFSKASKAANGYFFRGSGSAVSVCRNRCVPEGHDCKAILTMKDDVSVRGMGETTSSSSAASPAVEAIPTLNGLRFAVKGTRLRFVLKMETKQSGI